MRKANLANVSTAKLQRELERRREQLAKLIAQRDELNRRIAELEGTAAPERPAKKAKRAVTRKRQASSKPRKGEPTLKDALAQVLEGKDGLSIAQATEELLAQGYKTRSKNPKLLVKQALYHGGRFKRVGRGLFALKK